MGTGDGNPIPTSADAGARPSSFRRYGVNRHDPGTMARHQASALVRKYTHTHTRFTYGLLSGTIQVSRYEKGKTSLDFTEARDSEWQWHQLDHMQVCTSLQT